MFVDISYNTSDKCLINTVCYKLQSEAFELKEHF